MELFPVEIFAAFLPFQYLPFQVFLSFLFISFFTTHPPALPTRSIELVELGDAAQAAGGRCCIHAACRPRGKKSGRAVVLGTADRPSQLLTIRWSASSLGPSLSLPFKGVPWSRPRPTWHGGCGRRLLAGLLRALGALPGRVHAVCTDAFVLSSRAASKRAQTTDETADTAASLLRM
jgi:hypothetical protein